MIDTAKERERLAAFDGHTDGPWESFIDDRGGQWRGWPVCIGAVNEVDKTVVRTGGQWPYEWGAKTSQHEAVQNARLCAAAPDLKRDYLAALDVVDALAAEIDMLREALHDAFNALGELLGDSDFNLYESDDELRAEEPAQWACKRIADSLWGSEP